MAHASAETVIPVMTSNIAPSGRAFAQRESSDNPAWRAFSNTSYYADNSRTFVGYLGYEFNKKIKIMKYAITPSNSTTAPKDWTFEGSNDGANWDILDTQVDQAVNIKMEYIINTSMIDSYKLYRLNWTTNGGSPYYLRIVKLEMFEILHDNKILISSEDEYYSVIPEVYTTETAIPTMTSNITPSGRAFAGSENSSGSGAWRAFEDSTNPYFSGNLSAGYLGYQFTHLKSIGKYTMRSVTSNTTVGNTLKDWTFEGSNNSTDGLNGVWDALDEQKNQVWTTGEKKDYFIDVSKIKAYNSYRLRWIEENGSNVTRNINKFEMYEYTPPKLLTLADKSEQTFLNHGMNKDISVDLTTSKVSERRYIVQDSSQLGSGKVFRQKIDTSKILIKNAMVE